MSIRSIDLQVLYSKTSDVERVQQIQQQQDKIQQQQVTADTSAKRVVQEQQVVQTPRSEGGRIEERPERRRARRKGKGDLTDEADTTSETPEPAPSPKGTIDICV